MTDPIIDALRTEQVRNAIEMCKRAPSHVDPIHQYGYAAGVYAGFEMAIQRVLKLYRDEKEDLLE